MNIACTIIVQDIAQATELAGATNGAAWFSAARHIVDASPTGLSVIDFQGVRLATVSWMREAVLALRKYAGAMRPDIVFAVANLAPLVREEFDEALRATNNVFLVVHDTTDRTGIGAVLLGVLDPALRETLSVVDGKAEFDATLICQSLPTVAPSAANNRLASLEKKGILTSTRRGRTRIYRPILEGLHYGH
jgi:DNA-binding transcriptional ArsR family regulator